MSDRLISDKKQVFITPILGLSPTEDGNLHFELDEIDDLLYMVDKYCSGTVQLKFSEKVLHNGKVFLNGKPHNDFKIMDDFWNGMFPSLISVKLRGYITEYGSNALLRLEGFTTLDGCEIPPYECQIDVKERHNDYSEKYREHNDVAYRAGIESVVLLKNENNTLPLEGKSTLNLFGRGVTEYRNSLMGAARIFPRCMRNIVHAVEEASDFQLNRELIEFYKVPNNDVPPLDLLEHAKKLNDTAVVIITRGSGESTDTRLVKGEYYLSDTEETLLKSVSECFNKTVVILNVGFPMDISFIEKFGIDACLWTGYGGMFATESIMDILSGKVNPSGKLPDTWGYDYFDLPASKNFFTADDLAKEIKGPKWSRIVYEEGPYIGYRYFTTFNKPCIYPFGYGLSYTSFKTECLNFSADEKSVSVTVGITNVGKISGKQTVQLYVSKPQGKLEQVEIELIDFDKTEILDPDETAEISLHIPLSRIKSYDTKKAEWIICEGKYKFFLGEDALHTKYIGELTVEKELCIKKVENHLSCPIDIKELSRYSEDRPKGQSKIFTESPINIPPVPHISVCFDEVSESLDFSELVKVPSKAKQFVCALKDDELCRLNVCSNDSWNMVRRAAAGFLATVPGLGLPDFALCDGNNGVNVPEPNIGMPSSCSVAATFNKKLAYEIGLVIGAEALEKKIDVILGPGMNLHRNPLCGRNAEYFSEDPLLTGVMAGYQSKGQQESGVCSSLKHVVANNCETLRAQSDSVMTERTLRELYIKAFEYALEIDLPDTIMTGYNAVNGQYNANSKELIEDIFIKELGFCGFVMTDWNSYCSADRAAMIRAGVSLLTPGSTDDTQVAPLRKALASGEITRAELECNVERLLRVIATRIGKRK